MKAEEKKLERKLTVDVQKLGGYCLKFISTETGVPDRIVILPGGIIVFVELKSEGRTLSPKQTIWRNRLTQSGHKYFVIDSEKSYICCVNQLRNLIK